jgi:uncharacterized membrane protein SirB2
MMGLLKSTHLVCAALSFSGFFIRGIWMAIDSPRLQQRWVKVTPHVIDTLLLASAVMLILQWPAPLLSQNWLIAKIIALLVYIAAGMVALRWGKTKSMRISAWLFGLLIFSYIVSVAFSKSAWGWLGHF